MAFHKCPEKVTLARQSPISRAVDLPSRISSRMYWAQDWLNQSQKMTATAMHMFEKKVWAQRSLAWIEP
jgi:hypothetical protein